MESQLGFPGYRSHLEILISIKLLTLSQQAKILSRSKCVGMRLTMQLIIGKKFLYPVKYFKTNKILAE